MENDRDNLAKELETLRAMLIDEAANEAYLPGD